MGMMLLKVRLPPHGAEVGLTARRLCQNSQPCLLLPQGRCVDADHESKFWSVSAFFNIVLFTRVWQIKQPGCMVKPHISPGRPDTEHNRSQGEVAN